MAATLYERLGYRAGIYHFANVLYQRVLRDPVLRPFFVATNTVQLADHMASFLSAAAGGPDGYYGKSIREAHAGLHIGAKELEALLQNVSLTAEELRIEPGAAAELIALIARAAEELPDPDERRDLN